MKQGELKLDGIDKMILNRLISDARTPILSIAREVGISGAAIHQRLRKLEVELLARQHDGSPFLQIVKIFEVDGAQRLEIDYWCEICSIAMFELKPCDCCQQDIILRKRPVDARR